MVTTGDASSRTSYEQACRDYERLEPAFRWLAEHPSERAPDRLSAAAKLSDAELQRRLARWCAGAPSRFIVLASRASIRSRAQATTGSTGRSPLVAHRVHAVSTREPRTSVRGIGIRFGFHPSPFGDALLLASEHGLCALGFVCNGDRDATYRDLVSRYPQACFEHAPQATAPLAERVFSDRPHALPVHLIGTPFQLQVWRALLEIPPGALTTYRALARRIGAPRAIRAVGSANAANPISYLVPCHRVVRTSGALGGYYYGLARKLALIGAEAIRAGQRP